MDYMTVDQLSAYIKLSKSTIYKKVMNREIPFIKATGSLLFSRTSIDNWLESYSQPTVATEENHIHEFLKTKKV